MQTRVIASEVRRRKHKVACTVRSPSRSKPAWQTPTRSRQDDEADDAEPPDAVRVPRPHDSRFRRLSKTELNRGRELYPEEDYWRPTTRGECADMERPCPFVSCKYHLYIDVHPVRGSIKINFPDVEVWEMTDTCALDIADRGGITLEEVGEIMNLTRERVRQLETQGLAKLQGIDDVDRLRDYVG